MPINSKVRLKENIFDQKSLEQKPTREGFGVGLVEVADANLDVVGLCADLTESTRMEPFAKKYPLRFIEVGVAEQNLAAVASGMAAMGKIPFITSYAMFSPGRNWEQIRTTICYNDQNVKIIGSHAGVSVGPDGATHQAIEDIAIMRVLPNMHVFAPCDMEEGRKVIWAIVKTKSPSYVRFTREKTPVFTTIDTPFEIGTANVFWDAPDGKNPDIAIFACGPLLYHAILAAAKLEREGIAVRVLNMASIKPMDEASVISAAQESGAVVTVEEHQVAGGMGSAVAEIIARHYPVPIEFVGVQDRFGESGSPAELIEAFGMSDAHIIRAAERAIKRK